MLMMDDRIVIYSLQLPAIEIAMLLQMDKEGGRFWLLLITLGERLLGKQLEDGHCLN